MGVSKRLVPPISKGQIKIIYTLGQELKIVDKSIEQDILHATVEKITGKRHITDLMSYEADQVINKLRANMKGFERLEVQRPSHMATNGEIKKIWALLYEVRNYDPPGESTPMQKRLRGFLKKYAGVDDIRFLTHADANNIIEGLKGLIQTLERHKFDKG